MFIWVNGSYSNQYETCEEKRWGLRRWNYSRVRLSIKGGWVSRIRIERDISWVDRPSSTMGYPRAPAGPYLAGLPSKIGWVPSQIGLRYREGGGCKTRLSKKQQKRWFFFPKKAMHWWVALGRQSSRVVRYPEALSPYRAAPLPRLRCPTTFKCDGDG